MKVTSMIRQELNNYIKVHKMSPDFVVLGSSILAKLCEETRVEIVHTFYYAGIPIVRTIEAPEAIGFANNFKKE